MRAKELLLCLLSATLLILSFPNFNLWLFAWFGFVPLFLAIEGKSKAKAFLLSYITGVIFWFGVVYWLIHVTFPGLILLVLYLALYFGVFGFLISLFAVQYSLFSIPAIWILLEYLRSHLFTGFPWTLLGYSQYLNLPIIQIADITGVWGVSFLVMMANVAILQFIIRSRVKGQGLSVKNEKVYLFPILCICIVLAYGYYKIYSLPLTPCLLPLRISVIQGNIPQELKWESSARASILDKYLRITSEAAKDKPDLIIWPEAALPVVLEEEMTYYERITAFTKAIKIPLLMGAVRRQNEIYYNSAILISAEGHAAKIYDKLHLVPFGEYIPLRRILPFLETVVPIGDFTAGREYTIFKLPITDYRLPITFSVLVCFEDLFPELSRGFVRRGVDFLVNITNDAWFGKTSSPYQHLQASVFRAVENRVAVVRAANTGISGFIAPTGKIISLVGVFVDGYKTDQIRLSLKTLTFYSRFGDLFIFLCILLIFYVIIALPRKRR